MTTSTSRFLLILFIILFTLTAGAVILFQVSRESEVNISEIQPRIIIPQNINKGAEDSVSYSELLAREENINSKIPLEEGEVIVSVLNGNFFSSLMEEQFVVYRNLLEIDSPIYITFIKYDEISRQYVRAWNAPTAATRPGTIRLFTQDLIGDRSTCVLVSGMNGPGEHTLTVFHSVSPQNENDYFNKIAELMIDGTITIRETARSQAYQLGFGRGQSFNIAAYGRDFESKNLLDQIEIIYAFNEENGLYEQTTKTRIPGTQIEQRRVRELLGNTDAFAEFITGLWYYTTPNGIIDKEQYIYFDPPNNEIIFYGDNTQQVFNWQNSTATRYGLYISSQNISITTLRRSIDIELESLNSIKLRVYEDVRLNKGVNTSWDGSYRKAGPPERRTETVSAVDAFIDAHYDSSIGRVRFSSDGSVAISLNGISRQGKYSFFNMNDQELLELRFQNASGTQREIYLVEGEKPAVPEGLEAAPLRKSLTLLRARIGATGVELLHESSVLLTLAAE